MKNLSSPAAALLVSSICLCIVLVWHSFETKNISDGQFGMGYAMNAHQFTVSEENQTYTYSLDSAATLLQGTAAMTGVQQGIDDGGALLTLHHLSFDATSLFHQEFDGKTQCPAPFFNRYAQQTILIPADEVVAKQLSQWEIDNYQDTSRWETFSLKGRCINRLINGRRNGENVTMPESYFKKCRFMVIENLRHIGV
jgi:hypothetical protein